MHFSISQASGLTIEGTDPQPEVKDGDYLVW